MTQSKQAALALGVTGYTTSSVDLERPSSKGGIVIAANETPPTGIETEGDADLRS
jgi:hypothetical protein